ncbi:hypothetical protein BE221DRAFT_79343, partial [Ostreococcus tauri]
VTSSVHRTTWLWLISTTEGTRWESRLTLGFSFGFIGSYWVVLGRCSRRGFAFGFSFGFSFRRVLARSLRRSLGAPGAPRGRPRGVL